MNQDPSRLLSELKARLSGFSDLEDALEVVLREISTAYGFALGHAFIQRLPGLAEFLSTRVWYVEDRGSTANFRRISECLKLSPNLGILVDLPMENALFYPRLSELSSYIRICDAQAARLESVLVVPLKVQSGVPSMVEEKVPCGHELALVLEFYQTVSKPPTSEDLRAIEAVAALLIPLLQRRRESLLAGRSQLEAYTQEQFRRTFQESPIATNLLSLDGKMIAVNRAYCKVTGYPESELLGKSPYELTLPEDRTLSAEIARSVAKGDGTRQFEKRYLRKDGVVIWVKVTTSLVRGADGTPLHIIGMLEEVTHTKKVETELDLLQRRLQAVVSTAPLIIFTLDRDGFFTFTQGKGLALLGRQDNQAVGENAFELYSAYPAVLDCVRRAMAGESISVVVKVKDFYFETRYMPAYTQSGKLDGVIGVALDVTERKHAEERIADQQQLLVQSAKMTALGQMASSISHEINNPLTVIYGTAKLLDKHLRKPIPDLQVMRDGLTKIQAVSIRIVKVIEGLRAFSKDTAQEPFEKVPLKRIIEDTLVFCEQRFRTHGIELEVDDYDPGLELECRPVQISEVLLNLLNNAHDAVEDLADECRWVRIGVETGPHSVKLHIADGGKGVSDEIRNHIFEPFFSTKPIGKGTGLGLSISKGIVESHQGEILLNPDVEHTCFSVVLPLEQDEPPKLAR